MPQYGTIGQKLFSAFQAGADVEEFEELICSHLPPAFGEPLCFCKEQDRAGLRTVDATVYSDTLDAAHGPEDLPIPDGEESYHVVVDVRLNYKPETELKAVMLVRATVKVKCGTRLRDRSYDVRFRDIDEAFDEVERLVGGRSFQ